MCRFVNYETASQERAFSDGHKLRMIYHHQYLGDGDKRQTDCVIMMLRSLLYENIQYPAFPAV
jgi:hypothetical protein